MNGLIDIAAARAELYQRAVPSRLFIDYVGHHRIDLDLAAGFCGSLAVLPVLVFDGGMFDFAEAGQEDAFEAVVIEAFDKDGETVLDLVAWPIEKPEHALTLYRRAPMVGMWQAMSPYQYSFARPLILHRTPLDWLKADCDGAAIVTPYRAARTLLDLPGRFAPQDHEHAREVDRLIRSLSRDRMVVPRDRSDAA